MKAEDQVNINCVVCYCDYNSNGNVPVMICGNSHYVCMSCHKRFLQNPLPYNCPFCKAKLGKDAPPFVARKAGMVCQQICEWLNGIKAYERDSDLLKKDHSMTMNDAVKMTSRTQAILHKNQHRNNKQTTSQINELHKLAQQQRQLIKELSQLNLQIQNHNDLYWLKKEALILEEQRRIKQLKRQNQKMQQHQIALIYENEALNTQNQQKREKFKKIETAEFVKKRQTNFVEQAILEQMQRDAEQYVRLCQQGKAKVILEKLPSIPTK